MSHEFIASCPLSRRTRLWLSSVKMVATCIAATGLVTPTRGQGLLDIGPSVVEEMEIPFTGSFSSSLGWDSDPGAGPTTGAGGGGNRGPEQASGESVVWQNSIALAYEARMKGRNRLGVTGNYTNLFYFDPPAGVDEMDHTGRVAVNYAREFSRSLTIADTAFVSYQTEPDYDIGASVNQRTTGYFLGSNRLAATYRWNRRFSTVTGYTISSIVYEDDTLENESYVKHEVSQQFRYAFKRRLTGTLSYRYGLTNYEESDAGGDVPIGAEGDYASQSLLAGVDYTWNRRLSVSASAGVEYRTYDGGELDDEVAPRVEAALNYMLAKRTSARWVHALSLDDTGRAGAQSGYSYRTGLMLQHILTRRLSGNLALNYIYQVYGDSGLGLDDITEQTFYTNVGLNYRLWKTWSLTGSYSYSIVESDDDFSDYNRHRLFFGMSYTF